MPITDSRWPPRRPAPPVDAALSQYPSYLAPPRPLPQRTRSPLVSALLAYVAAYVVRLVVTFAVALVLLSRGVGLVSQSRTDAEIEHAALTGLVIALVVMFVAGAAASYVVLRIREVRAALTVALVGQVGDVVVGFAGGKVSDAVGLAAGVLGGVGLMYLLIRPRRTGAGAVAR